ncbi:hypothetical protein [Halomarina oriensis]|uniref:Uncharacterized protein n=1 Tax=Halomarina oriensis TaxID=671145 RepID=A0A6B0GGU9_9EURY|nr:hypothetical protein [Halomarina oriensis]MWG33780.1 hypothetical protein [Halomarina oriensis]
MILSHDDVEWNTRAMARSRPTEGIEPSTASIIVRQFATCPECDADIDPDVTDAIVEDRDVFWRREGRRTAPHECDGCASALSIFVEEKAFGVISARQLPDWASDSETVVFIEVAGQDAYLVVNTYHIAVRALDVEADQPEASA